MTKLPNTMRFLLPASIAACLLMVSLHAADKPQTIALHYIAVSDAVEAIAKQLGAEAASAIITTDPKRNAITLREEHADAPEVRNLIASLDHKPEQLKLAMTITSKTAAKPGAPAKERVLARPTLIGPFGKPMIIAFEQNGETFQIEIQASVLKPQLKLAMTVTSKTAAKPGTPDKERVFARPILIGLPGKPMIIGFWQNGETFHIEVQASVLKP